MSLARGKPFTQAQLAPESSLRPVRSPASPLSGDVAVDSGDSNRIEVYNGSAWVSLNPAIPPGNYTAFFTSVTAVSIPGGTHNLGTGNLIVQCYDNSSPSNMVEPSQITIDPATFNVTVTFATAETGRCVLNGYNGASSSIGHRKRRRGHGVPVGGFRRCLEQPIHAYHRRQLFPRHAVQRPLRHADLLAYQFGVGDCHRRQHWHSVHLYGRHRNPQRRQFDDGQLHSGLRRGPGISPDFP